MTTELSCERSFFHNQRSWSFFLQSKVITKVITKVTCLCYSDYRSGFNVMQGKWLSTATQYFLFHFFLSGRVAVTQDSFRRFIINTLRHPGKLSFPPPLHVLQKRWLFEAITYKLGKHSTKIKDCTQINSCYKLNITKCFIPSYNNYQ